MSNALIGEWKLISSENFEELLKKLGVGLVARKMGQSFKPNIRFEKSGQDWTFTTLGALKHHELKFRIGEEFEEETLDGRKMLTTMTLNEPKLIQTQRDKDDNEVVCVITREVLPNGELKVVRILSY